MNTCPSCGKEYSEEECPHCVDKSSKRREAPEKDWVQLTTARDDIEFGMLKGLLEMADIPIIRRVRGIDGFLQIVLGAPLAGIQVMVPKDKYEEAKQLLDAQVVEEEQDT